jgi:hypothetical protein
MNACTIIVAQSQDAKGTKMAVKLEKLPFKLKFVCSIAAVLLQIDTAIQYGEDLDVETRDYGGED